MRGLTFCQIFFFAAYFNYLEIRELNKSFSALRNFLDVGQQRQDLQLNER